MLVTMSDKELNRVNVIQSVAERRMRQREAAERLGLSVRQVQRLVNRFRDSGAAGLVHLLRGRPGNHRLPESFRLRVLQLVQERYSDFGPTLAAEKLREEHGIVLSIETLRQWMIAAGLRRTRAKRKSRAYQPRYRRDCCGELIQIDGSHHDWFEGRSPKCCLLVFIDDATGRLMHLRFAETESAFDYMLATREYIAEHGKPLAFYSDKHSIFRVNHASGSKAGTQFGRVLRNIGVELICANSPQAKGRVERTNITLQDRLLREMRLKDISTIEEANAWLPGFIVDFNRRFAKVPASPENLHRPVTEPDDALDDIFSWQESRRVSKSLTFHYDKVIYLVEPTDENLRIAGETISVLDRPDGSLAFRYGGRNLSCRAFDKLKSIDQGEIVDNKRLGAVLRLAQNKMDELEQQGKRERGRSMPARRAQLRALEQLRAINPVLTSPEAFRSSVSRRESPATD